MKTSTLVFLSLFLIIGTAASNAVMDALSFRYDSSIFPQDAARRQWWDPADSWRNKWAGGDPKQGEAFPLSSTALVSVTDAWHFFKGVTIFCVLAAIILPFTKLFAWPWPMWIGVFIGLKLLYGLGFEGLFAHFLIR